MAESPILAEQEIRDRIKELAPFHHYVDLPYGLNTFLCNEPNQNGNRRRMSMVIDHGWPALLKACGGSLDGLRVLDVACNSGGYSVYATRTGAREVVGFDVVEQYIEQANFVREALGPEFSGMQFRKLGVEEVSVDALGTFDVTLCFGILYHMQDPVSTMQKIASVTERVMFLGTTTFNPPSRWPRRDLDQAIWRMNVRNPDGTTASGWLDEPKMQFEPTPRAVMDLLRFLGFSKVTPVESSGNGGPRINGLFLAVR
jgi:tRNA (mo5U34)-methyltransferase